MTPWLPIRRFRFGLRSLFVLMTVVAVLAFAFVRYRGEPPDEQIWPGMWLHSRSTGRMIHIKSWKRGDGVPSLTGLLASRDPEIRAQAAGWLGAIGAPAHSALPELRKSMMDPDAEVRTAAASAVKQVEADRVRR